MQEKFTFNFHQVIYRLSIQSVIIHHKQQINTKIIRFDSGFCFNSSFSMVLFIYLFFLLLVINWRYLCWKILILILLLTISNYISINFTSDRIYLNDFLPFHFSFYFLRDFKSQMYIKCECDIVNKSMINEMLNTI